jgi:hypothetical protein
VPVVGVTVGEALAEALPFLGGRSLWCAIPSRRGRVFLEIGDTVISCAETDLPVPDRPVAIAGSAAMAIAARLAATGVNVMLTDARLPLGRHVALIGARRFRQQIRPLATEPLYVDEAQATPPPGGLPPSPIG